jgi:hypothetical protein
MPCPTHSVIPGRGEAASPESIATGLSDQLATGEYGFRAPAFGRPRNDAPRIAEPMSSKQVNDIYASDVIYAHAAHNVI